MKATKHPIYCGAFLLTVSGIFCRLIGFYYKIFLSRTIGSRELGLYQLSIPLLSLGIAFAGSGMHTALSKYVAKESAHKDSTRAKYYLITGLLISMLLSLVFCIPCYLLAEPIAVYIFGESAITPLLRILIFCIPLECMHGCINGYYYGLQKAAIPSGGQCIEQLLRVGSTMGFYYILTQSGLSFTKIHAMLALLIGEIGVTLYYLTALSLSADSTGHQRKLPQQNRSLLHRTQEFKDQFLPMVTGLGNMSAPVTANRLFMTALGTTENILIPQKLAEFGLSQSQALGIYGIYSGMVLPMIFFPMVFANSIAVMLLPSISRAKEEGRHRQILHAVHLSFFLCMLFGFCCAFFFYYGGPIMGTKIFENQAAGIYIRTLSWLCPFLFLSAAMSSILNGLGKTKDTFFLNLSGAVIRIGFIQFGVPRFGFRAFLLGVLLSQIILSLLAYLRVLKITGEAS